MFGASLAAEFVASQMGYIIVATFFTGSCFSGSETVAGNVNEVNYLTSFI